MENENGGSESVAAPVAENVNEVSSDQFAGMLKFKDTPTDEAQPEAKATEEVKKVEEAKETPKPGSKEWAVFAKKEKEIRLEKETIKTEKEQIEKDKKFINDFKTKVDLAQKDLSAGISLFEELTGGNWDEYIDWMAAGAEGENPLATHNKKKLEKEKTDKENQEHQELTAQKRLQVKEVLINNIKAQGEKYELIQSVGAENGVEAVMLRIEDEMAKSGQLPSKETIEKWFEEVEENTANYLKQVGKSKKAMSLFSPQGEAEAKKVNVEETPQSDSKKSSGITLSQEYSSVQAPVVKEIDLNEPWDKQMEKLTSMLKFKD